MFYDKVKFDLHVHAKLSKPIPFNIDSLNLMLDQAQRRELDGFALTEHIHAPDYREIYQSLRKRFPYRKGIFYPDSHLYLLNGAEITLKDGGDIIILGEMEAVNFLDRSLDLNQGYHPSLSEFLSKIPKGVLLIGAHPFRPNGGLVKYASCELAHLCALELNGRDFGLEDQVKQVADKLGLPLVGGSDAHFWPQLGIRSTILPLDKVTISGIEHLLQEGNVEVESSPDGPLMVGICARYKQKVKKACGLALTRE